MTVTVENVSESIIGSFRNFKFADVQSTSDAVGLSSWSLSIVLATAICLLLLKRWVVSKKVTLPPGPRGWPIIGSILELEPRFYRSFTRMAQKYGPIMHMKLGAWDTVVVSGLKETEMLFKSRDLEFASRPSNTVLRLANKYIGFNGDDIVFMRPYGPKLVNIKKICMKGLLSTTQLKGQVQLRNNEINRLVQAFAAASDKGEPVQLRGHLLDMTTNMTSQLVLGRGLFGDNGIVDPELKAFRDVVHDLQIVLATMNIAALIPALEWLDPAGVIPKYKSIQARLEKHLRRIVEEHKQERATLSTATTAGNKVKDFCDLLLDYEGDSENKKLTDNQVMAVLFDMMAGATETSTSVSEWGLAQLIHKPSVLQRLQQEVDSVVGLSRAVEESDLRSMPLLDAVVKETFRLHPPIPLLLPHMNEEATTLGGYDIPKHTCLYINVWAIGRDPTLWDNAPEFDPDRFLRNDCTIGMGGSNYELLPFGTGRRICPGVNLGILMVKHPLAAMVHAIDWSPAPGQTIDDISFSEEAAIALRMAEPLVGTPKARATAKYYTVSDRTGQTPAL